MESGKYKLLVNGSRESGVFIEKLWSTALRAFPVTETDKAKQILVFGIAGGTVIHLLHTLHPQAHITGVDIDPVMIGIGYDYFGLSRIDRFHSVCADAKAYVKSYRGPKMDVVVIDIFIGTEIPDFVLSRRFQDKLHTMLAKNGSLYINYLRKGDYEKKAARLHDVLSDIYSSVYSADMDYNRFFLAK